MSIDIVYMGYEGRKAVPRIVRSLFTVCYCLFLNAGGTYQNTKPQCRHVSQPPPFPQLFVEPPGSCADKTMKLPLPIAIMTTVFKMVAALTFLVALTTSGVMGQHSCVQVNSTEFSSCPCADATLMFNQEGKTMLASNTVSQRAERA